MRVRDNILGDDPSLVAYYQLEDVNDFKGTNHLTNFGSTPFTQAKFGTGADLGPTNTTRYLNINSNLGFTPTSDVSISGWVKLNTELTTGAYVMFRLMSTGNGGNFSLYYNKPSGHSLWLYNGGNQVSYNFSLGTTNWYHVVITRSAGLAILYVNGVAQNSTDQGVVAFTGNVFSIGAEGDTGGGNKASGIFDDVAVFNRALTSTEVANLYQDYAAPSLKLTRIQSISTVVSIKSNGVLNTATDSDAQAFVSATGIQDPIQISAIDTLVSSLKTNNLWTKFKFIYPFVGGTAFTHKFNLKDPRDLDAAYRLEYVTTQGTSSIVTHSSTGMTCAQDPSKSFGEGSRANTFCDPSAAGITTTSVHMAYYSRTNAIGNGNITEMGCVSGASGANALNMRIKYDATVRYADAYNASTGRLTISDSLPSNKLHVVSRTSASSLVMYRDATVLGTSSSAGGAVPFTHMHIGGLNNNPDNALATPWLVQTSYRECAFASLGDGLTAAEVTTLNTIVNTYQTTLGRNV